MDGKLAQNHAYLYPDPAEAPAGVLLQVLELLLVEELAVPVEVGDHPGKRPVQEVALGHGGVRRVVLPDEVDKLQERLERNGFLRGAKGHGREHGRRNRGNRQR
jgi:hypothetical protein